MLTLERVHLIYKVVQAMLQLAVVVCNIENQSFSSRSASHSRKLLHIELCIKVMRTVERLHGVEHALHRLVQVLHVLVQGARLMEDGLVLGGLFPQLLVTVVETLDLFVQCFVVSRFVGDRDGDFVDVTLKLRKVSACLIRCNETATEHGH